MEIMLVGEWFKPIPSIKQMINDSEKREELTPTSSFEFVTINDPLFNVERTFLVKHFMSNNIKKGE